MKKSKIAIAVLSATMLLSSTLCLSACHRKNNDGDSDGDKTDDKPTAPVAVTVTFNANGGAFAGGAETVTAAVKDDGTVELPEDPTRADYEFMGYNLSANGTGSLVTSVTVFTADTTVYAQWYNENDAPEIPSDPDDPVVYDSNFRLVGKIGDGKEWDKDSFDHIFKPVELAGSTSWKRYQLTLDLKAGNSVKIRTVYSYLDELDCDYVESFGADWGFNDFDFAAASAFATTDSDRNFVIKSGAGDSYTFTVDLNYANGKVCDHIITVGKGANGATVAAPTMGRGVYLKIGASEYQKQSSFTVGTDISGDKTEWSATDITIKTGDVIVFGSGGGNIVDTVEVKGNSGMTAFTVDNGEFTATVNGRFSFYYQPESGDVYIDNVTPVVLQHGDGVYADAELLMSFTGSATVTANNIEIKGDGTVDLTLKVRGSAVTELTLNTDADTAASGATVAGGVVTLAKGKRYSFSYSVHDSKLSIKASEIIAEPTPENYVDVPATAGAYGYLVGTIAGMGDSDDKGYKMTVDGKEYKLVNVLLHAGDKVKVRAGDSYANGSNKIRGGDAPATEGNDGYIHIGSDGYYSFYYADNYDGKLCQMWLTFDTEPTGTI